MYQLANEPGVDLYNNPSSKPSTNMPMVQDSPALSASDGFVSLLYYLAVFAFLWSLFYFVINARQFKYYTLSKRAKEHVNEWRGLDHWVSNYRILWTLLALQFPLVFVYLSVQANDGKGDPSSIFTFGILFVIFFLLKIFLDATHIYKLKDFIKDYASISVGNQIKVLFGKFTKKLADSTKKPEVKPPDKKK